MSVVRIKIFGYIRVSIANQNIARQEVEMKGLGIDERDIYVDFASNKDFNRLQYQYLKSRLLWGYVDALERL